MDENAESDRLSNLPDSLLIDILSLLEMKDVVSTTILSKRWKDLWTVVPCLDFYGQNQSFIEEALAKWKGAKILKFSLNLCVDGPPPSDLLDSWLLLSIQKQVEDLVLHLEYDIDEYDYRVPQPLYSCSFITRLSLFGCNLNMEENVQWNRLKSLVIELSSYLSEDAVNRIISGAPLLEELKLMSWNISQNLNIRSSSLKMLEIESTTLDVADFAGLNSVLSITAPKLEGLAISAEWHTSCLLDVPSLTNATLGLDFQQYHHAPSSLTGLKQAYESLSKHVQNITLNTFALKFLFGEIGKLDYFLPYPKLVMLIVNKFQYEHLKRYQSDSSASTPLFPAPHRTVEITWDVREETKVLSFVDILLEHPLAIKKLVIRQKKDMQYFLEINDVLTKRRDKNFWRAVKKRD